MSFAVVTKLPKCFQFVAPSLQRSIQTSAACCKVSSGRYKVTRNRDKPLTYEQANPPHFIFVRKGFNSYNTSNLLDGVRPSETAMEDVFIRKFMTGTWHNMFLSEVIIKRQLNMIRISGIIARNMLPRKIYFLIGYTEEMLTNWLQCPVKLELQTTEDRKDVIFKYI
ncbi:28S ribosomal protein S24, mitochondrial-like [Pollicipes pollicipes]|uniref:28S ribosomal protein S24, mitochondrial-like n=1 Tax=Pollicipes pollicipes TaxID=41117 RepID=UPI0018852A20|nr:28S ribosomal protein S24, mitochondrial-like [Pollicipes pollicipes]